MRVELALSDDLDVTLRALRGEYSESYEERKMLLPLLTEGVSSLNGTEEEKKPSQDYRILMSGHCRRNTLKSEAEALLTLHRNLVPKEGWKSSREAFCRFMTSLREGPWSGLTLEEATNRFLNNYLLGSDLESALGSLEIPPVSPGGIDGVSEEEDFVIIGGVKLKVQG